MESKVYDVSIITKHEFPGAMVYDLAEKKKHGAENDGSGIGLSEGSEEPRRQEIVEILSSSSSSEGGCHYDAVDDFDSDDDDDGDDDDIDIVWPPPPIRVTPDLSQVESISSSDSTSQDGGEDADQEDEGNDDDDGNSLDSFEDQERVQDDDDDDEVVVLEIPPVACAPARKAGYTEDSSDTSSSYERRRRDRKRPASLRSGSDLAKHFKNMDRKPPAKPRPGPVQATPSPRAVSLYPSIISPSSSQAHSIQAPPVSLTTITATTETKTFSSRSPLRQPVDTTIQIPSSQNETIATTTTKEGVIVCKDGWDEQDVYWEIDAVLDYKYRGGTLLWLVSWKKSDETSWVLDKDLCDSAKRDADILRNAKRLARKVRKQKGSLEEPIDLWAVDDDDASASTWEERPPRHDDDDDSDDENLSDADEEGDVDGAWPQRNRKKSKKRKASQARRQPKSRPQTTMASARKKKKSSRKNASTKNSAIRRVAFAPFMNTGGLRPEKSGMAMTFTVSNEIQEPDNFLRRLANGRSILKLEYDTASKALPVAQFPDGENRYSLVAIKNKRDKSYRGTSSWAGARSSEITLKYVQTNGEMPWNPREELEKVADFESLPRHKLSARLELLLTPAMKGPSLFDDWNVNMFEVLPEEDSYMGCGFIPDALMKEIYAARKKTAIDSLQVRIFAPCIGIAKGMLTSKLGINKIQIPPSMIKVGPSRKNKDPWAVMVVKTAAPSRYNRDLGRYLESPRPTKRDGTSPAERCTLKQLSEMYQNLFAGLGVPPDVVKQYSKRQLSLAGRKHAHLMGVCDPTGKLPEGTIFVTGYTRTTHNKKIHMSDCFRRLFVTRSPCLEPTDGRIVPLVQHKPSAMSEAEWQWLRDKPFGTMIFARPKNRHHAAPLPALIADGDLDGDLYFVLFDEELLPYLFRTFESKRMRGEQKELEATVRQENINLSEGPPPLSGTANPAWFTHAQEDMLNLDHIAGVGKLTGMMYRKSEKIGKEAKDKIWNPDARAFAKAFKQSLDAYKHGNAIELPHHLEPEVDLLDKTKDKALKRLIRFT